ncbi:MAG: YCF48-related protein [Bacillota bacterium]
MKLSILLIFIALSSCCFSQLQQPQWRTINTGINSNLRKITFSDSLHGWAISRNEVISTIDGGESWQKQTLPVDPIELRRLCFLNNNTGFAIGDGGLILATKDGGRNWVKQNSGDNEHLLRGISFLDDSTGWITGQMDNGKKRGGILLHTTNGGASWDTLSDRSDDILYFDVKFFDKMNGIVIGSIGWDNLDWMKIYGTADGGKTLNLINTFGGVQTFELYIAGKDTLWSGGFGFMKSIDKGRSWNKYSNVELPDSTKILLAFKDLLPTESNKGYAVISDIRGPDKITLRLYSTDNFGELWKIIPTPDGFRPLCISMAGKYLFAAGYNGLIITNKPKTSGLEDPGIEASSFELKQNYPNPFNPITTIDYSIPQMAYVEIKMHDLLGREVATLVNKEMNAGEYKVQFDGSSLPSGIYVYTIHAGQYISSRKLIVLK